MNDMPIIPLFYPVDNVVIPSHVKGYENGAVNIPYLGSVVIE